VAGSIVPTEFGSLLEHRELGDAESARDRPAMSRDDNVRSPIWVRSAASVRGHRMGKYPEPYIGGPGSSLTSPTIHASVRVRYEVLVSEGVDV
jgi:hypothetical protein